MRLLDEKVIYVVVSGAKKAALMSRAIREFTSDGARVYTILTDMGKKLCDISEYEEIRGNNISLDYSKEGKVLPLEDLVLVAPCTFNTLNKISGGIADSYPTTIVASAIGKKKKVIIVPAMNESLWEHPVTAESLKRLQSWGCSIIYPEITHEKITMAPVEKIADSVYHILVGVRYESEQVKANDQYRELLNQYFTEFRRVGEGLLDKGLTKDAGGCLSKKVDGGILVSASGSHVGNISKDEISLVTNRDGDKIYWMGYSRPSSESPLLLELYEEFPDVRAIVHGHCPRITYNDKMQKYTTPDYVRYGLFGESKQIINLLRKNDGFAILRLHGEVGIGKTLDDVFVKLNKKLEETHE